MWDASARSRARWRSCTWSRRPMATLLLEIGCEELPAAACREAEAQLPMLVERELGARPESVFVGPRRIAALLLDVDERTPDEWVKGPPEHLADKAAAGFAKRHGVEVEALEAREGFLGFERPGQPLAEALPEKVDAIVRGFAFSKSMRWEESGLRFSRPVRRLLVKLGTETVVGESSFGHRFSGGPLEIAAAEDYEERLRSAGVEPDAEERRRQIVSGLDSIGGWSDPGGVVEEVVYLVESVTVLEGRFDERFLQLPERVVVTAMQSHQRYFPLGGNRFAFVANGGEPALVRAGNEAVLEGRLEDLLDVPVEYVRAALASAAPDLAAVARLAEFLYAERDSPEFEGVYTAYDRAHRLAGRAAEEAAPEVDRALLREDAERALAEGLGAVSVDGEVRKALESAATLAPLMERFFDEVLVMDEDPAVRGNRLRLLLDVRDTLGRLGDFSQIPK